MKKISLLTIFFVCLAIFGNTKVQADDVDINPLSYTAPITLNWLSKAGVPEAVELIGNLSAANLLNQVPIQDAERVEKANAIYQELHYSALNEYIKNHGYKTVIDLGCGVSPRGIVMARNGINYIGVELEPVAKAMQEYTPMFLNDKELNYIRYEVADFTDRDAMMATVKNVQGPVCIVSELVMVFLSKAQQDALFNNIHEILEEHGGCFVTADYTTGEIFYDGTAEIYGEKATDIIAEETVKLYAGISETDFTGTIFDTHKESMEFIKNHGFKIKRVPLLSDASKMYSVKNLNDKQIKKIQRFARKKLLWVMTVK